MHLKTVALEELDEVVLVQAHEQRHNVHGCEPGSDIRGSWIKGRRTGTEKGPQTSGLEQQRSKSGARVEH
eukprot:1157281-Pelagomonas_calceolata.AAC.7